MNAVSGLEELRERYAAQGQGHVFRFWDRLSPGEREVLLAQARGIDLDALGAQLEATRALAAPGARCLEPAPAQRLPERGGSLEDRESARERGEALLRAGRVAVMVVAGGQGTRLGFPGPKGLFPIGPITERALFALQAQRIHAARRRYGCALAWCVMTSRATDEATRAFFARNACFGLPEEDVLFFQQGTLPALDFGGKLMLETPSRISESPDGHGGSFTALCDSGVLERLEERGVSLISYYQVDNPLVELADPLYLGFHDLHGAEMSCKVIEKLDPMEKMGVVARIDGRVGIVEYTEIDDEHRFAQDDQGRLVYWAGSTGIHVLSAEFVRRIVKDADRFLPYHAAAKKIPVVDEEGHPVIPSEPNGHKLERFVFDALPAAEAVTVVEVRRAEQYSPVKNAEGSDSPATARRDLVASYRRWLEEAGVICPPGTSTIEIDQSRFDGVEDLRASGLSNVDSVPDSIRIASGASAS